VSIWSKGTCILISSVFINSAAGAQQTSSPALDAATTLVTVAAFYPQRLIDDPPLTTPSDRPTWQIVRPCLQKIRSAYQAHLPLLAEQLRKTQIALGQQTQGTAADSAWNDAINYVRAMHISELAITDGSSLASDPDFQLQKNEMDRAWTLNETWKQLNPNAPGLLESVIPMSSAIYRELLRTQCQL